MVEIMVTLLLTTIIMGILYVVLSSTFKISGQVQTQLAIDEEVMRLNSNLHQIISRNWTGLSLGTVDESDTSRILSLQSRFPIIPFSTDATISYEEDKLVLSFLRNPTDVSTRVLAEHLSDFAFEYEGQFVYYTAVFNIEGEFRETKGAVRFY